MELSLNLKPEPSASHPSFIGEYITYYPSFSLLGTSIPSSRAAVSSHCIFVQIRKSIPDSQTEPKVPSLENGARATYPCDNLHKHMQLFYSISFQTSFVPLKHPSPWTPSRDYPKAWFPFPPFSKVISGSKWLNLRNSFCSLFYCYLKKL